MQLTSIFTFTILALGVNSHPSLNVLARSQQPSCSGGQVYNCAHNTCYDKNNDYCQNTGWGSTWCQPPPEYPPETCPGKQKWCANKNECECPAPMWWDDSSKECKYQPMPEPSCPPLQSPYCGKSKEEWCSYG
ncbi:hypothetical protein V8E51_015671 [Hyaloscypha variabilis]